MKKCAVIIPFYKKDLSPWEKKSYLRTVEMLQNYELFAIEPRESNFHAVQSFRDPSVSLIEFQPDFFDGIAGYNRLMLSNDFYQAFADFQFVLIVQLDAMVLHAELDQFLFQDEWDYVGAPWVGFDICANPMLRAHLPWYRQFSIVNKVLLKLNIWDVGNGGVSLRRVSAFLKVLRMNSEKKQYPLERFELNEDNFWSFCASKVSTDFSVASFSDALKFAFETAPRQSFLLNESSLPFACHAFEKHDFKFWLEKFKTIGIHEPKGSSFEL